MAKFDKFLGKIVERVVGGVIDPGVVPDASTSAKGIIQLATGAEVTAGTDTAKAVVPATLKTELDKKVDKVAGKGLSTNDYDNTEKAKVAAALTSVPDASTSAKGIIQLATGAEVTAGTDTAKAVVPSTLKTELDKKVDKVAGKGLSTNDYDNTEKAKVAAALTSVPDASTSAKGIIQLATGAEVTAGTDTAKAVVPSTLKTELDKKVDKVAGKGLSTNDYDNTEKAKVAAALTSVPDASTSAKGIIQLATGAEVTAGTDTAKAVVPATLKTELDKKVDKVAGKGLSTNDYDNTEKAKVAAALTSVPDASTSTKGIVQLATGAEVTAGTNTAKAVVPATLKTELDKKVDKVAGKGLSTNDYDNTEKAKVAAAETEVTLGIDTVSGDATKFLNQKKQWVVPAGGSGSAPDASTSTKGIIQLATGAEVTAGTDTAKAVVPATLKTELDKKVDKVAGKGLSTNDYTTNEKNKVAAALTSVPDASTSTKGIVQLATGAEVTAGTDTAKAVVPATLKTELDKKVDKVAGKGLSTNDYDNTEKAKVAAAETEVTLGIDTVSGDATKFLNQKKQWVVPGGSGSGPTVELLSTMPTPGSGDVGRVALFTGASTGAYVQNKLYRAVNETAINPTGNITVSGNNEWTSGTYAYVSGTGDSRLWQKTVGSMIHQIYYYSGQWVIHSYEDDGYEGMIHFDECRAVMASGGDPWDGTWETSWDEGYSGNNGPVPTVTAASVATYAWRPLLPPLTAFASTTPTIYPGGRYTNFNPSEGVLNGAFTFNIGGYEGCYGDAEVIMVIPHPGAVTVSGGPGLTLVDALAAAKRNFCVIKFFGTTARLFVVHTEDL